MADTVVDRLYGEFGALVTHLDQSAEPSLRNTAEETFRKALLLSSASHFEARITDIVYRFARDSTHPATPIPELIRKKALSRQFHTLFDWKTTNANAFFGLFGEDFKAHMQGRIQADPAIGERIKAFMETCAERNRLVHEDYGAFTLEKTAEEIFTLFTSGLQFVDALRSYLDDYVAKETAAAGGTPAQG